MNVFATSAYDDGQDMVARFLHCHHLDRFSVHQCVSDPGQADIILFVENSRYDDDPMFSRLNRHPLVRRFPDRCFMYNESAMPWCVVPGLYCSMPRRFFQPGRQRACGYLSSVNAHIERSTDDEEPDCLFSFMGAATARVRDRIFKLDDPDGKIIDTTGFNAFAGDRAQKADQMRSYATVLRRSKFVLCPRGFATSSFRLYETMRAGRCPVILADDWVPPVGPLWDTFSIRVAESRVATIPDLLRGREPEYRELGQRARMAYDEWIADDVKFHRMVEDCAAILRERRFLEALRRHVPSPYRFWRASYFRASVAKTRLRGLLSGFAKTGRALIARSGT